MYHPHICGSDGKAKMENSELGTQLGTQYPVPVPSCGDQCIFASFDSILILKRDPGPRMLCATFVASTYVCKYRECRNGELSLGPSERFQWSFFRVPAPIDSGGPQETFVYYKSGDCSIWSPQQRTFNSLLVRRASALWVCR